MPGPPAWLLFLCCCTFQDVRWSPLNFRLCWNPQEKDHSSTLQLLLHQLPSLLTDSATVSLPFRLGFSYGTYSLAQYGPAVTVSPPYASNNYALTPSKGISPNFFKAFSFCSTSSYHFLSCIKILARHTLEGFVFSLILFLEWKKATQERTSNPVPCGNPMPVFNIKLRQVHWPIGNIKIEAAVYFSFNFFLFCSPKEFYRVPMATNARSN